MAIISYLTFLRQDVAVQTQRNVLETITVVIKGELVNTKYGSKSAEMRTINA